MEKLNWEKGRGSDKVCQKKGILKQHVLNMGRKGSYCFQLSPTEKEEQNYASNIE